MFGRCDISKPELDRSIAVESGLWPIKEEAWGTQHRVLIESPRRRVYPAEVRALWPQAREARLQPPAKVGIDSHINPALVGRKDVYKPRQRFTIVDGLTARSGRMQYAPTATIAVPVDARLRVSPRVLRVSATPVPVPYSPTRPLAHSPTHHGVAVAGTGVALSRSRVVRAARPQEPSGSKSLARWKCSRASARRGGVQRW